MILKVGPHDVQPGWRRATYVVAVLIGFLSFGMLLRAEWYIIDDHEIIEFLGGKPAISLDDAIRSLLASEVNLSSTFVRFRPVYYIFRLMEAMFFGNTVSLWYGLRIAVFVVFGIVLGRVMLRFFEPRLACFFTALLLVHPYWTDIIARLGPAETYAVAGFTLILLAFFSNAVWVPRVSALVMLAAGVIICAGVKENFVLFSAVPAFVAFRLRRRLFFRHWVILTAPVLFCAWIALTVLYRIHLNGDHDIYAQSTSFSDRVKVGLSFFTALSIIPGLYLWMVLLVGFGWWYFRTPKGIAVQQAEPCFEGVAKKVIGINALCLCFYFTQFIFYNGSWPSSNGRYNFPGLLVRDFAIALVISCALEAARLVTRDQVGSRFTLTAFKRKWSPTTYQCLYYGTLTVIGAAILILLPLSALRSQAMVTGSTTFMTDIRKASAFLSTHPDAVLVVEPHEPFDFEPVFSTAIFIRAEGVKNPIMLTLKGPQMSVDAQQDRLLFKNLVASLAAVSAQGGQGFQPLDLSKVNSGNCYSISMSAPPDGTCDQGDQVWPL